MNINSDRLQHRGQTTIMILFFSAAVRMVYFYYLFSFFFFKPIKYPRFVNTSMCIYECVFKDNLFLFLDLNRGIRIVYAGHHYYCYNVFRNFLFMDLVNVNLLI